MWLMYMLVVNMKIVSAIYLRCHTVLKDDWISKSDTDSDMEDGMVSNILQLLVDMSFIVCFGRCKKSI